MGRGAGRSEGREARRFEERRSAAVSGWSGGGGHEVDLGGRARSDTMQPEIKQTRKALDSLLNGDDPLEALVLAGKWLLL
jgi:hypothetical protein